MYSDAGPSFHRTFSMKLFFQTLFLKYIIFPHMISLAPQAWQCWLTAHRFTWGENSFYNLESQQLRVISDATIINISEHSIWQETFAHNKDPPWITAMYKTRNTGVGIGMRGTRGIGGMLYSRECCQTFRGMSSNISGKVAEGMSSNIQSSGECHQIFQGMSSNILGMSPNIPGNIVKYSGEC